MAQDRRGRSGKLKRAVKLVDTGHAARLDKFCSAWSIRMVGLFADCQNEAGGLRPWRGECLFDQPYQEVLALRVIRSEWGRRRQARIDKGR